MPRRRRRRGSRGRAPPELRLAYGARARPLGDAILSLLPPPPQRDSVCPNCRGRDSGCLACCRWAYLLRDDDNVAYRRLVTRAFCAVAPAGAAPPPPRYTPGNAGHTQAKLVRETIKWIMADRSCTTKNVLLNGCREGGLTTCVSDLVSSSSWDKLLQRIGDLFMCYVLRHSSIFLPIKKKDYYQVTGVPLNVVLQKPIFVSTLGRNKKSQSIKVKCPTCYVWNNAWTMQNISGSNCGNSSKFGFYSSENSNQKVDALQRSKSCGAVRIIEPQVSSEGCHRSKFLSSGRSTQCSRCYIQEPRKRKRLYSWQRRNKQKQICYEDRSPTEWSEFYSHNFNLCNVQSKGSAANVNGYAHSLEPAADNTSLAINNDNNSSQNKEPHNEAVLSSEKSLSSVLDISPFQGLSCGYNTLGVKSTYAQAGFASYLHLNSGPICFNCLMLNASKCISVDALISRHAIFYNRRTSYNVFHCNRILL